MDIDLHGGDQCRERSEVHARGSRPTQRRRRSQIGASEVSDLVEILGHSTAGLRRLQRQLDDRGIRTAFFGETSKRGVPQVVTMHSAKVLEFLRAILFDVLEGTVPQPIALQGLLGTDLEDAILRERSLPYVATTRARDEMVVAWAGKPSSLMGWVKLRKSDPLERESFRDSPTAAADPTVLLQLCQVGCRPRRASQGELTDMVNLAVPDSRGSQHHGGTMFRAALERFRTADEKLVRDVADSKRFIWLGSGISRDQVPDLVKIIELMLIELRDRAANGSAESEIHRDALISILTEHLSEELPRYAADPDTWEPIDAEPLRNVYSDVVGTRVGSKPRDYLLLEVAQLVQTYGAPDLEPGPIHYYLAILIAEGMVRHLASGNWDGLVETALNRLTSTPEWLDVYVVADDRRHENGFAQLAKFHGCAVLALRSPDIYQDKIIATRAQISRFGTRAEFAHMRTWLAQRTEQDRSLVLGLSVQDHDLLDVFTKAAEAHPWPWDPDRPAYVFAQPELRAEQLDVLENCYNGEFDAQRDAIIERSAFGNYAGPVVAALTWRSLTLKTDAMLARAHIDSTQLANELSAGIHGLEAEIPRRLGYSETRLLKFLTGPYSAIVRDYYGPRDMAGRYAVAVRGSLTHVATDPSVSLVASDLLACAIGFVGWGLAAGRWELSLEMADGEARLALTGNASAPTGVRIVRGPVEADEILRSDDWVQTDSDRVILYMHDRPRSPHRSTASRMGSRRRPGNRVEISWRDLVTDVNSIGEAATRFLSAAGA